ncbi:MAG: alpha/beta hydrolase [Acidobacteria bacterium]|nr:MAG: alpha/beta hydrolase [Acidobacteriota bacterium]TDI45175.1 MAG: alpha/beta hydrolase [Acidobacteriota bacterium]
MGQTSHEPAAWTAEKMEPMNLAHTVLGPPDGQVILFLHGITGSRRYFLKKVRSLADRYRLLLPDLPGFGDSPKPRTSYTVEFYRDEVRRMVEALGCADQPIHIVGHSLGALISLEYAALYPGQVGRLVFLGLPRFEDSQAAHDYFWRGSASYRRLLNEHSLAENLAQVRRSGLAMSVQYVLRFPMAVLRDSRKFTLNSLTSTLENCLLNYRVDEVLERAPKIPILMLHGLLDQVAPLENVRALPESYANIRLVEIGGSGHHIFLTHTRRCLELMEEHLTGTAVTVAAAKKNAASHKAAPGDFSPGL